jgi:hypothetical protein
MNGDFVMASWKYVFVIEETKEPISKLVESVTSDIPTSSLVQLHEFHKADGHQYFGTDDLDTAIMLRAVGGKELQDLEINDLFAELETVK